MSQNDLSIANQGFASFRSDLNSALQALGSTNSGSSAPSTTYANQLFYDTANNILKIRNEDNDAFISLFTLDQANDNIESLAINGALSCEGFTSNGIDDNADAVAITIDSSENVLVGRTSTISGGSNSSSGAQIGSNGIIQSAVSGDTAISLQRLSDNGDIIQFRKDTTSVGSIGTGSSRLAIGNGDTFLTMAGDLDALYPASSSQTTPRDNAVDLGTSGTRFNNLYLSGGVFVGGTGPSNKLDDYEEGTFTPFFGGSSGDPSSSYAVQKGKYTKVGDMVCATFVVIATGTPSGGGGSLLIAGLPFAFATTNTQAQGCIGIVNNITNNMSTSQLALVGQSNGTNLNVMNCAGTSTTGTNNIGVSSVHNSGARIDGTIVYSITA